MRFLLAFVILVAVPASGQDVKPEVPETATVSEVKLKDADAAKMQNLQLVLQNLALQAQNAQLQAELIKKDIPAVIDQLYATYKLDKNEWSFDEAKMQFVRKARTEARH